VNQSRERVNGLVGHLANIVAARAPVTGTHFEGTTQIRDHVLDRSKFESKEVYDIADAIEGELRKGNDPDGFIASSYFNSKLFALSVDIVNGIQEGGEIRAHAAAALALGSDPSVKLWLERSQYWPAYSNLRVRLRRYVRQHVPGESSQALEGTYKNREQALQMLKRQMDEYEALGEDEPYNSVLPLYNEQVAALNSLARRLRFRATASQKLDLDFNRCFDAAILLGAFHRVDLTSHRQEIEALPEAP